MSTDRQKKPVVRKRKAPKVSVSIGRAVCDIYSTVPMTCFLCGERVPAKTAHHCERAEGGPR